MSKTEPVAAAIKAVDGIAADVIGALQSGEYMIHVSHHNIQTLMIQ